MSSHKKYKTTTENTNWSRTHLFQDATKYAAIISCPPWQLLLFLYRVAPIIEHRSQRRQMVGSPWQCSVLSPGKTGREMRMTASGCAPLFHSGPVARRRSDARPLMASAASSMSCMTRVAACRTVCLSAPLIRQSKRTQPSCP